MKANYNNKQLPFRLVASLIASFTDSDEIRPNIYKKGTTITEFYFGVRSNQPYDKVLKDIDAVMPELFEMINKENLSFDDFEQLPIKHQIYGLYKVTKVLTEDGCIDNADIARVKDVDDLCVNPIYKDYI